MTHMYVHTGWVKNSVIFELKKNVFQKKIPLAKLIRIKVIYLMMTLTL